MNKSSETRVRVRYKETDQMGIAHHANYLVWFELGRTDLCRLAGMPYSEIEAQGVILVVTEVVCRYVAPFRYDDEVVVRTRIESSNARKIVFAYELFDATDHRRASGRTSHVWLDAERRRPVRAPDAILEMFDPWCDGGEVGP